MHAKINPKNYAYTSMISAGLADTLVTAVGALTLAKSSLVILTPGLLFTGLTGFGGLGASGSSDLIAFDARRGPVASFKVISNSLPARNKYVDKRQETDQVRDNF